MDFFGESIAFWGFPKNAGFPQQPLVFLLKSKKDQHLGCEMGVPPFKETPIWGWKWLKVL